MRVGGKVRREGEKVARDQLTPLIRSEGEGGRGKHPNKVLFPTAPIICTVLPSISLSPVSVLL